MLEKLPLGFQVLTSHAVASAALVDGRVTGEGCTGRSFGRKLSQPITGTVLAVYLQGQRKITLRGFKSGFSRIPVLLTCQILQGGAEPTDTFRI